MYLNPHYVIQTEKMVLESLIRVKTARRHPERMILLSIILSSIGIWISYFTFPNSASILSLAFVTVAMVPFFHTLFVSEEREELSKKGSPATFLERHFDLIKIYGFFFIGLILSYSFWYVALPTEMRSSIFSEQESTLGNISALRSSLTGNIALTENKICGENILCWTEVIFANNLMVLFLAIIFSFIYASGAIFLIGWNASIIAVVIGQDALQLMAVYSSVGIGAGLVAWIHGLFNALGFLPHGIPEIGGYFVGAIAGGIIAVLVAKKKFQRNELSRIGKDVAILLLLSVALLFLGAVIEAALIVGG